MRRRATTGVDGTRGVGFCFFPLERCSGVGGEWEREQECEAELRGTHSQAEGV